MLIFLGLALLVFVLIAAALYVASGVEKPPPAVPPAVPTRFARDSLGYYLQGSGGYVHTLNVTHVVREPTMLDVGRSIEQAIAEHGADTPLDITLNRRDGEPSP